MLRSPSSLCCSVDVGLAIKHNNEESAMAAWLSHENLGRALHAMHSQLVGHVIPVFGQIRETEAGGRTRRKRPTSNQRYMAPIDDGPHPFAFRPVVIATNADPSDTRPEASQGMFAALGVVVSNKMYNYPCGNERRVCTRPNPAFDETVAWVLVTHVYGNGQGIFMASVAPPRVVKGPAGLVVLDTEHRNAHESTFKWRAHIQHHLDNVCADKSPVSAFGLSDIKQTVKDMFRNIVASATIIDTHRTLRELRESGELDSALVHVPMKATDDNSRQKRPLASQGIDLRRCLLVEMLLTGTPLQPLLGDGSDAHTQAELQLPEVASVHGGPKELYARAKAFADAAYPAAAEAATQIAAEVAEATGAGAGAEAEAEAAVAEAEAEAVAEAVAEAAVAEAEAVAEAAVAEAEAVAEAAVAEAAVAEAAAEAAAAEA